MPRLRKKSIKRARSLSRQRMRVKDEHVKKPIEDIKPLQAVKKVAVEDTRPCQSYEKVEQLKINVDDMNKKMEDLNNEIDDIVKEANEKIKEIEVELEKEKNKNKNKSCVTLIFTNDMEMLENIKDKGIEKLNYEKLVMIL